MPRPRHPRRESVSTLVHVTMVTTPTGVSTSCSPQIEPLSGLLEGGTLVTISGSNLGQKVEDIVRSVAVAGVPCSVIADLYEISSRIVCRTGAAGGERSGKVSVKVSGGELGLSADTFAYQVCSCTTTLRRRPRAALASWPCPSGPVCDGGLPRPRTKGRRDGSDHRGQKSADRAAV